MNELTFLISLLLHHKLRKDTKTAIQDRIELIARHSSEFIDNRLSKHDPNVAPPSKLPLKVPIDGPEPVPLEQIAQTPAAQAAMALRQEMLNNARNGTSLEKSAVKAHALPNGPPGKL
jgi:hypothetical protein